MVATGGTGSGTSDGGNVAVTNTGKVTTTSPMLQKTVTRPCACTCHQEEDAPTYTREHLYTVQARRGGNGSWNQIMRATTSSEAYAYAKQCAEEARSAGENNIDYRVVQTDADGAKIAQIVTPDGLGDLNPLNLLWIEKMEREDASKERT